MRYLYLSGFENIDSLDLTYFPHLEELVLSSVRDVDLGKFVELPSLTSLTLKSCRVKGDFADLSSLRSLTVEGLHSGGNLRILNGLPNLTSLELKQVSGANNLNRVANLSRLTTLSIVDVYFDDDDRRERPTDVLPLANLDRLEVLRVVGWSLTGFEHLQGNARLRSLKADGFTSFDIEQLSELTQLATLHVGGWVRNSLDSLAGLQSLTSLSIRTTGDLDVRPLSRLARLETLELVGDDFDGRMLLLSHLSDLATLPHLTSIDLDGWKVFDLPRDLYAFSERTTITRGRHFRGGVVEV